MAKIGELAGMSRVAVRKRLLKAGIDTSKKGACWVDCFCAYCYKPIKVLRALWHQNKQHYCGSECYYAFLANPKYVESRQGERIARKIVATLFPLEPQHIVHHIDGNEGNNELTNLLVYACQADHMRAHRGSEDKPIWSSRKDSLKD